MFRGSWLAPSTLWILGENHVIVLSSKALLPAEQSLLPSVRFLIPRTENDTQPSLLPGEGCKGQDERAPMSLALRE